MTFAFPFPSLIFNLEILLLISGASIQRQKRFAPLPTENYSATLVAPSTLKRSANSKLNYRQKRLSPWFLVPALFEASLQKTSEPADDIDFIPVAPSIAEGMDFDLNFQQNNPTKPRKGKFLMWGFWYFASKVVADSIVDSIITPEPILEGATHRRRRSLSTPGQILCPSDSNPEAILIQKSNSTNISKDYFLFRLLCKPQIPTSSNIGGAAESSDQSSFRRESLFAFGQLLCPNGSISKTIPVPPSDAPNLPGFYFWGFYCVPQTLNSSKSDTNLPRIFKKDTDIRKRRSLSNSETNGSSSKKVARSAMDYTKGTSSIIKALCTNLQFYMLL